MLKFSIITPVYNRADCISRCIESVYNQNASDDVQWEHILVDDGSVDETAKIIQEYSNKIDSIKFISFSINKGTNAARNAAIANATGDYCIILDSDDYFRSDALSYIANVINSNTSFSEFAFATDDRQDYYSNLPMLRTNNTVQFTFEDFLLERVKGDFVHVIQTNTLRKYPFDESVRIYEGVFFLRFYRESQKILFTNYIITNRERGREDSITLTGMEINRGALLKAKLAINFHIKWFKKDYLSKGYNKEYAAKLLKKLRYCIMLGEYDETKSILGELKSYSIPIPNILLFLNMFKLGTLYQTIFSFLLRKKYHIKN